MERVEVPCRHCGKTILVKASRKERTKYCSQECRHLAERTRYEISCKECGRNFITIPSQGAEFCSKPCEHAYKIKHPDDNTVILGCEYCGKEFRVLPSRSRRFCSKACAYQAHIGEVRKPRVEKHCLECGKTYYAYKSRENRKYCPDCDGRKHESSYRDTRICGPKHHWFLGYKEKRYGTNWDEQSEKARERDNNTCRVCGKHDHRFYKKLPVHHISARRNFKTLEELETTGNRLENLVTLCPSCHQKAERGEVSEQQLRAIVR